MKDQKSRTKKENKPDFQEAAPFIQTNDRDEKIETRIERIPVSLRSVNYGKKVLVRTGKKKARSGIGTRLGLLVNLS